MRKNQLRWFVLCFFFLWLSTVKSSLQGLGFSLLFWFLFVGLWFWREVKIRPKYLGLTALGLVVVLLGGVAFHWQAIGIFLASVHKFVPAKNLSFFSQIAKKVAALVFSFGSFILGDIPFSFSTVDLSKILGSLGAREYFSYDGNSYFIHPWVSLIFMLFFGKTILNRSSRDRREREWADKLLWIFLIDIAVVILPTYRLFYFRFHQWWLTVNLLLVFGFLIHEGFISTVTSRLFKSVMIAMFAVPMILAAFIYHYKEKLLTAISGHGYLGFEPGFWESRVNDLMGRLLFADSYSGLFLLILPVGYLAYRSNQKEILLIAASISGIALGTLFYNRPQPRMPFYNYRQALLEGGARSSLGRPQPDNVNLLVNKPAYSIYESLEFPMPQPPSPR